MTEIPATKKPLMPLRNDRAETAYPSHDSNPPEGSMEQFLVLSTSPEHKIYESEVMNAHYSFLFLTYSPSHMSLS